jgi:hypothetical protein
MLVADQRTDVRGIDRGHFGEQFRLPLTYQEQNDADDRENSTNNIESHKVTSLQIRNSDNVEGLLPTASCVALGQLLPSSAGQSHSVYRIAERGVQKLI